MKNFLLLNILLLFIFFTLQLSTSYANDKFNEKDSIDEFVKRVVVPVTQPKSHNIQENQLPAKQNVEIFENSLKENAIVKGKKNLIDEKYNSFSFEKNYRPNLKRWKWNDE